MNTDPRWLVFRYRPVTLFSLKMSRATSTAGKTLLTPTPYAVKMAFVDAALRHSLACVTGTIQSVRQETREVERKRNPHLAWYRANIAMREFVHFRGDLRLVFDLQTCQAELPTQLRQIAPAINYLGKRGSFFQYMGSMEHHELDSTFTRPVDKDGSVVTEGLRATLDDFGPAASFDALNSFSATEMKWDHSAEGLQHRAKLHPLLRTGWYSLENPVTQGTEISVAFASECGLPRRPFAFSQAT